MAIRSRDISRTHRERLIANGFLREVIKGWYVASRPDEAAGDSTPWYASFWDFCAAYLHERFGQDWCLSPEQSLSLHGGSRTVPVQLLVRAPRGGNKPTALPHGTSLFDVRATMPDESEIVVQDGLRLYSPPAALVGVAEDFFRRHPTDARAAMVAVKDASDVLGLLLKGGHSTIAGRLAGAFRNAGAARIADDIVRTMAAAGFTVRETDPFTTAPRGPVMARPQSPYVNRIRVMWEAMRGPVLHTFPAPPGIPRDAAGYLQAVEDVYVNDAYHSLSIDGYRVSAALIERVRSGGWDPQRNAEDRANRHALAARGYYGAFQGVKTSVERVLRGGNPGTIAHDDHSEWYRRLFGPSATAGIIAATDLAATAADRSSSALQTRAATARGGEGLHACTLRTDGRGAGARGARRARTFRVRVHPPLCRREWPHGAPPDERHAGVWRLSLDGDSVGAPRPVHGRPGSRQCRAGHRVVRGVHWRTCAGCAVGKTAGCRPGRSIEGLDVRSNHLFLK